MTKLIPIVENSFDLNDIFVISGIIIFYSLIFILPKIFTKKSVYILLIFYGITAASVFDNTIGAHIFDYYDIMDGKKYTVMDLVAYLLYGPFGYFLIYFYEKLKIQGIYTIFYILVWTLLSLVFEWLNVKMGVFTYKNGYQIYFSSAVYLYVQYILIQLYVSIIKERGYSGSRSISRTQYS